MLSRFRPARSRRRMGLVAPLLLVLGIMLSSASPAGAVNYQNVSYLAYGGSTTVGAYAISRIDNGNGATAWSDAIGYVLSQGENKLQVEFAISPGVNSVSLTTFYMMDIQAPRTGYEKITITGYDASDNNVGSVTIDTEDVSGQVLTFSAPAVRIRATHDNNNGAGASLIYFAFDADAVKCDKPGNGNGDKNHEHCGPPGQLKKQG